MLRWKVNSAPTPSRYAAATAAMNVTIRRPIDGCGGSGAAARMLAHRGAAAPVRRHRRHQQRRVEADLEQVDPPVEMRRGYAARAAQGADHVPLRHLFAVGDRDRREMR